MNDCYGIVILFIAAFVIYMVLCACKNKNAGTLQLQQRFKTIQDINTIIGDGDIADEQDLTNRRFGFESYRDFGQRFVNDQTSPKESIGVFEKDRDDFIRSPTYKADYFTPRAGASSSDDGDDDLNGGNPILPIDLSQEPTGQYTKSELLVNPAFREQAAIGFVDERRRGRTPRGPPSASAAPDIRDFGDAIVRESSRDSGYVHPDIGLDIEIPQTPDATMLSRSNINKLAADTLQRHPQNPVNFRGHHTQLAARHIEDTSNGAKRLTASSYMTPEKNSREEMYVPTIPQGARRSTQSRQHSKSPFTYQVFLVSQNLIYTPITVMPYDENNNQILMEPLVFNFQNSFITSNGVQELHFSTDRYVDIKFIELNTMLTQQGWNGKIWIRIYSGGNLISTLDYNSANDPQYGWQRFVCSSGQAAYSLKEAETSCVGGVVRR